MRSNSRRRQREESNYSFLIIIERKDGKEVYLTYVYRSNDIWYESMIIMENGRPVVGNFLEIFRIFERTTLFALTVNPNPKNVEH